MITTLPGLYLLSVGVVKPASWIFGWSEHVVCSIGMLRFVNLLFSVGNFYLLYLLLRKVQPRHKVCFQNILSLCTGRSTIMVNLWNFVESVFNDNCMYFVKLKQVFYPRFRRCLCLNIWKTNLFIKYINFHELSQFSKYLLSLFCVLSTETTEVSEAVFFL